MGLLLCYVYWGVYDSSDVAVCSLRGLISCYREPHALLLICLLKRWWLWIWYNQIMHNIRGECYWLFLLNSQETWIYWHNMICSMQGLLLMVCDGDSSTQQWKTFLLTCCVINRRGSELLMCQKRAEDALLAKVARLESRYHESTGIMEGVEQMTMCWDEWLQKWWVWWSPILNDPKDDTSSWSWVICMTGHAWRLPLEMSLGKVLWSGWWCGNRTREIIIPGDYCL